MANQQGKRKIVLTEETARQIFPVSSWGVGFESMIRITWFLDFQIVEYYKQKFFFDIGYICGLR
jgi:hypothetical protein